MTPPLTDKARSRRRELARFLKARRDAVQPSDLGIAVRRRRRARGLLREEVADVAGMSVTWYTWLEQARPVNPSARVLDGLADALRLGPTERLHLYRLARPDLRPRDATPTSGQLSPALDALLHGLAPHPAYIINARGDVLAWNDPAARVFGGFAHLADDERNILHRLLLDPVWRSLFVDWEEIVSLAIAQFRATTARHETDPKLAPFIESLSRKSPLFVKLWAQQLVAPPRLCRKTLEHPGVGRMTFDYAGLRAEGGPADLRITIYTPSDVSSTERMRRLAESVNPRVTALS
jgi:transcriptional regulator with XRE-family HTH domain